MFYKRSLSIDNVYGDFLNFFDIQEYNSKKKMIPEWQIQTQLFCLPKDIMGISFFVLKVQSNIIFNIYLFFKNMLISAELYHLVDNKQSI